MKLSYREKIGLLVVVVLAVIIVFIAWPIKLTRQNIEKHKAQEASVQELYDKTQREIAQIPGIEANINAIYEDTKGLSEKFVNHMDNVEFAKYFETLLNKAPYNTKKNGKLSLELTSGLNIADATAGNIPFYYYVPDVLTYPILKLADTNGDLMEKNNSVLYKKAENAMKMKEFKAEAVETRTVGIPMRFTKEALLALEDELKKETGIRITGVSIGDYTFAQASEVPEEKEFSEGTVTLEFYTMQQIQKPVFE